MKNKNICGNCRHFNPMATTSKTWGKCENEKNETYVIGLGVIKFYVKDNEGMEELTDILENGIRYPEDFGCRFFEPYPKKNIFKIIVQKLGQLKNSLYLWYIKNK